ncbi:MAG TPA: cytochrome c-type biogenesis protein CcmH [Candidatus Eisenbacteria bacterium]|nr:cytochrome c-type biogenesis protein CcmH [Candidatus Eisenbacteria bacterium]
MYAVVALGLLGHSRAIVASTVDEHARAINHEYMSPYCPGLLLADCSSSGAMTLRNEVRAALTAGVPEAEVRAEIERLFGERILAMPPWRGLGLVAWLAPYVGLALASGVVVAWWRRQMRASAPTADVTPSAVDPALRAQLEAELRHS